MVTNWSINIKGIYSYWDKCWRKKSNFLFSTAVQILSDIILVFLVFSSCSDEYLSRTLLSIFFSIKLLTRTCLMGFFYCCLIQFFQNQLQNWSASQASDHHNSAFCHYFSASVLLKKPRKNLCTRLENFSNVFFLNNIT